MNNTTVRRVYLGTYSQAQREKFPNRKYFGEAVAAAFSSVTGKVAVQYWACLLESHENGGEHYHVCVKLSGPKSWLSTLLRGFMLKPLQWMFEVFCNPACDKLAWMKAGGRGNFPKRFSMGNFSS